MSRYPDRMPDDLRTFDWPRAPAEVFVADDRERPVGELLDVMLARHDAAWYRHAIAEHGAERVAGLEMLDWLGCGEAHTDLDAAQHAAEHLVDGVWRRDDLGHDTNADDLTACAVMVTTSDMVAAFTRAGWLGPAPAVAVRLVPDPPTDSERDDEGTDA